MNPQDRAECRAKYDRSQNYIMLPDDKVQPKKPSHEFYATFLQRMRYVEDEHIPLAAVSFTPDSPIGNLLINPNNMGPMHLLGFAAIIVHELNHVAKDHVYYEEARRDPKLWNIATDIECNVVTEQIGYALPNGYHLKDGWAGKTESGDDKGIELITLEGACEMLNTPVPLDDQGKPMRDKPALWYYNYFRASIDEQLEQETSCPACGGTGQVPDQDQSQDQPDDQGDQDSQGQPAGQDAGDSTQPGGDQGQGGNDPGDQGQGQQGLQGQQPGGNQPGDQNPGSGQQPGNQPGQPGTGNGPQHGTSGKPCPCCSGQGKSKIRDIVDWLSDKTGHDKWGELNQQDPEMRELARKFAAAAFDDAVKDSPSGCPGHLSQDYENAVKILRPEIRWFDKVEEFHGGAGQYNPWQNPRRFNKRDRLGKPAFKADTILAAIVDVSGSVTNAEFGCFMGANLAIMDRMDTDIYVIEVDTEVKAAYWLSETGLKDSYTDNNQTVNRHGSGGTVLEPGFAHLWNVLETEGFEFGGVIVFTDGELFSWPEPDQVHDNTLWVITLKQQLSAKPEGVPGEAIHFDLKQGRRY